MKTDRRDAGSLMITVIEMIFIVSIIIFAGSTLVISGSKNAHTVSDMKQAHYMAEAGVEDALSDPYLVKDVIKDALEKAHGLPGKSYEFSSSFPELEANKIGKYYVKVTADLEKEEIEIASTGWVEKESGNILTKPKRTIVCRFKIKPGSYYDLALKSAIVSDSYLTLNNKANISGDVIAKGKITLNQNIQVEGNVISAGSYIDINNNVKVTGDTVAYGTDNKGYAVYLSNNSTVGDIYTPTGAASEVEPNGSYKSIKPIEPTYPATYEIPQKFLPTIDDEIKNLWIAQAKSDDDIRTGNLNVSEPIDIGNAYIDGNLTLNQNSQLNIKEGSIVYVTGNITIGNKATITVDGDSEPKLSSSLITEGIFDIENKFNRSVSLIALGTGTSSLKNKSDSDDDAPKIGTILIPNGTLEIKNNAFVYGGIFANSISEIKNKAEAQCDPLSNLSLPPVATSSDALNLLEWKEGVKEEEEG